MTGQEILKKIRDTRVVPLFYHHDAGLSSKVMQAVFEGGIEVLEFTNRGERAMEVFRELVAYKHKAHPGAALGIGSIVDADAARQFIKAGADFVVSPLLKKEVLEACREEGILHIPGCSTLTEIHQAETWGTEMIKVFPAAQLGGPAYIKAIKGPCPWLSLLVTGGVKATAEDLEAWNRAGAEGFGMGSDLIPKDLVERGDFEALKRKVQELVRIVRQLK